MRVRLVGVEHLQNGKVAFAGERAYDSIRERFHGEVLKVKAVDRGRSAVLQSRQRERGCLDLFEERPIEPLPVRQARRLQHRDTRAGKNEKFGALGGL